MNTRCCHPICEIDTPATHPGDIFHGCYLGLVWCRFGTALIYLQVRDIGTTATPLYSAISLARRHVGKLGKPYVSLRTGGRGL